MKKTFSALLVFLFLAFANNSFAQSSLSAAAKDSVKMAKKAARARVKADKKTAADSAKTKANTVTNTVTTQTTNATTTVPKTPVVKMQPVNKSADKAIGTDAKGRTIYQGARDGQYTFTANGNKEYIKKDK
jgi:colicin import membrane protein